MEFILLPKNKCLNCGKLLKWHQYSSELCGICKSFMFLLKENKNDVEWSQKNNKCMRRGCLAPRKDDDCKLCIFCYKEALEKISNEDCTTIWLD